MNSATNSSIASARPRSEQRTFPAHRTACPMHFCPPAKRVAESSRTPSNLPNAPLPARGATCDLPTLHSRRATCAMRRCLLLRTFTHISSTCLAASSSRMLACMLLAHASAHLAQHLSSQLVPSCLATCLPASSSGMLACMLLAHAPAHIAPHAAPHITPHVSPNASPQAPPV